MLCVWVFPFVPLIVLLLLWDGMSSLFFFFSSRRRHTRCLSDWSSDVCSSDLLLRTSGAPVTHRPRGGTPALRSLERRARGLDSTLPGCRVHASRDPCARGGLEPTGPLVRSEERRVGKEERTRWGPDQLERKER